MRETPSGPTQPEHRVTQHELETEKNYWSDFYRHAEFENASTFCSLVQQIPGLPGAIIDIGAGQGRDSIAFARETNSFVIGIDRSTEGVASANRKATNNGLENKLTFIECDVTNRDKLLTVFNQARSTAPDGRVCYYMRFFLHSITEDAQEILMRTIADHAQTSDILAAEFRTDKDEFAQHEFGEAHYRRFQNANEFSSRLQNEYGWATILHEVESTGLSPYKNEDPVLYRAIAQR